jgi:hypothetical protein
MFKNDDIKCSMITANSNTLLNGADYNMSYNVLAYASSNLIHINDIKSVKTFLTLKSHSQRVNSVKWVNSHKYKVNYINIESKSRTYINRIRFKNNQLARITR